MMIKMTHDEFRKRLSTIDRAMALYGEAAGYNINRALEMLNEPDFEISVPAASMTGMTGSVFDQFRPKCPVCGSDCYLRPVPPNDDGVTVQVICQNRECDTILDSDLSLIEWEKMLREEANGTV